tara:strand:- start:3791 stop:3988 length:198 start_codon:yes stop_codon:yes gene_type:complete
MMNITNQKTFMILYNLVDNSPSAKTIIDIIGQEKYNYYYPLYLLIKNDSLRNSFKKYNLLRKKNF